MLACFKNIYRSFRFGDNVIPLFGSSFVFMVLSCFVAVMAIFYSIVFGKILLFKKKRTEMGTFESSNIYGKGP